MLKAIFKIIWENTGRTDDPDPVTGLTSRDRYIIKTTWTKLTSGLNNLETGMNIFTLLFSKHPEYQQLFPFRDVPRDQLRENNRFKAHCVSLMYGFTSIIDSIETPSLLEQLLVKQGIAHVPRKVPKHAYRELEEVLLELFRKTMNEEAMKTWEKFLDLGFSIILKGAESIQK